MTAKVPRIDRGRAMLGIRVADAFRRKRKITMITSPRVTAIVTLMSSKASRMFLDRSPRMLRWAAGGSWAWNTGSKLLILSVTSITLLPGWRITMRLIAREPALRL